MPKIADKPRRIGFQLASEDEGGGDE